MKLLDFLLEQDAHGGEPASIERAAWAQFGHSLTQRLYERCFQTSKDEDYARFMAMEWASDDLTAVEAWRVEMAILTYLVDLFDVYD
jgi:hypothetical protein